MVENAGGEFVLVNRVAPLTVSFELPEVDVLVAVRAGQRKASITP